MPLEIEIDPELNALVIRAYGVVDSSDFTKLVDQIAITPGFKPDMNQLVDFTPGSLSLPENASRELVKFFESASVVETLGSSYKLAFVAARKVDFGQLRMYEAHAGADFERRGLELQVFYSLEEAKLWLRGAPG